MPSPADSWMVAASPCHTYPHTAVIINVTMPPPADGFVGWGRQGEREPAGVRRPFPREQRPDAARRRRYDLDGDLRGQRELQPVPL